MAVGETALFFVLVIGGLARGESADVFTVGGRDGWGFPPNGVATFYDDWAAKQTFVVGDQLLFPYEASHDVMEVSKADLISCVTTSPIAHWTQSNPIVNLTTPGYHGYICSLIGHCDAYMKININVLSASPTAAPPPTSTPTSGLPVSPLGSPATPPPLSTSPPAAPPTMAPAPASVQSTLAPAPSTVPGGAQTPSAPAPSISKTPAPSSLSTPPTASPPSFTLPIVEEPALAPRGNQSAASALRCGCAMIASALVAGVAAILI